MEEVTAANVRTIKQLEKAAQRDESFGDRIATEINRVCGSMTFLWLNAFGFIAWMSVNTVMLEKPWDPFPFSFLTLVVSLEAIFLSIFLLIAGNRQARVAERRSHLDLQINLLAEQENTKAMTLLRLIAEKLEVEQEVDEEFAVLEQSTSAETLIGQIDSMDQETDKV
ncbi:MAG: DUF1003 domain-containing protein [Verrucomicrobiota bacterium]